MEGSVEEGSGEGTELSFKAHMKTVDKNCYECKVRYRDPKPKDLVMFLHALKYSVSEATVRYLKFL